MILISDGSSVCVGFKCPVNCSTETITFVWDPREKVAQNQCFSLHYLCQARVRFRCHKPAGLANSFWAQLLLSWTKTRKNVSPTFIVQHQTDTVNEGLVNKVNYLSKARYFFLSWLVGTKTETRLQIH